MTTTYEEKYDQARPSYVRVNEKRFADLPAGTTILIPSPQDIELELRRLGTHEYITPKELRARLADRHCTEGTCPVMTGMNMRIVAEVALEQMSGGALMSEVAPVWLVIAPDSALAQKLPGSALRIQQLRALNGE
jgi:hypothetical protein